MFDEILKKHEDKKNVADLCKKLIKRCSFNSGSDAEMLCHLAYWCYIYGDEDSTLAISCYTHSIPFPGKAAFRVWTFILYIWGLECYIYQKNGRIEALQERTAEIDKIRHTPVGDRTAESVKILETKIRTRTCYEDVICRDKIDYASSEDLANRYRFTALFTMIGWGATGHYPDLNLHHEELKKDIENYISILLKI